MPAFIVIIYVGIIGAAILYKVREDQAAQATANAQPNGYDIAQAAAADFDPLIEGEQQGNLLDLQIAQGDPIPGELDPSEVSTVAGNTAFEANENPSTASLS
jgi:hypothetical protein